MGVSLVCSNYSDENLTFDLWELSDQFQDISLTIGAILSIFMLIGIPWNLTVIAIIIKKRLFKQPAVLLLLNLALTDLLLCVLVLPLHAVTAVSGHFVFGSSDRVRCLVCQTGILLTTLLLVSVYNIALLSVDRLLYVKKPMNYENIVTVKRVLAVLICFWVFFVAFSMLPFLGIGEISLGDVISTCTIVFSSIGTDDEDFVYLWVFIGAICILPVLVLFVANVWMLCIMSRTVSKGFHRQVSTITMGNSRRQSLYTRLKDRYQNCQLRLLEVFGALFGVNFVTWLPTVLSLSLVTAGVIAPGFIAFAHLCLLSQVVFHPVLQVALLRDIRDAIANMCKHCSGCYSSSSCSQNDIK